MPQAQLSGFRNDNVMSAQDGRPADAFSRWLTRITQLVNGLLGPTGIGNGANGNMQAPSIGTGSGPTNPNLVHHWVEEVDPSTGAIGWRPIFH